MKKCFTVLNHIKNEKIRIGILLTEKEIFSKTNYVGNYYKVYEFYLSPSLNKNNKVTIYKYKFNTTVYIS